MKASLLFSFALLSVMQTSYSQNLRLVFPQIAAGDEISTAVDLANKGSKDFVGQVSVLTSDYRYLPISINGSFVTGDYAIRVPPNSVIRLTLTRSGNTVAGYLIVSDSKTAVDYGDQISGTIIYQWRNGNLLLDSIGVTPGGYLEQFFFTAESGGEVNTGLAVANPFNQTVTANLKAFSDSGQFVDGRSFQLQPGHHAAFLINEKLSLPQGFRGTIEVDVDGLVSPLVLRLEKTQLSAVGVNTMWGSYDFSIVLDDARRFEGQMAFGIGNALVVGVLGFINPKPDTGFEQFPVTGFALKGAVYANSLFVQGAKTAIITLISGSFKPTLPAITGTVVWATDAGSRLGTFNAVKR